MEKVKLRYGQKYRTRTGPTVRVVTAWPGEDRYVIAYASGVRLWICNPRRAENVGIEWDPYIPEIREEVE